jgi:hypothetical protein
MTTKMQKGSVVAEFYYDADGNRTLTVNKTANGQTETETGRVYAPFPDYEVEDPVTGANTVRTTYRLAGQIVAVQTKTGTNPGTFYYTYSDHLGNVAALSSKAGSFTTGSLTRYDPFGNYRTWPGSNVNPAISQPSTMAHGFTGHRHNNTGPYPTQNVGADLHERPLLSAGGRAVCLAGLHRARSI